MLGRSWNSSSNPGVQVFTLLTFMYISLLMWSQTLWKARQSCVPVTLQFTSGTACRKVTQIFLIQPIFCRAVLLCRRLFEGVSASACHRQCECRRAKSRAAHDSCLQGQRWTSSGCRGMFLFIMSVNFATNEITANTSVISL